MTNLNKIREYLITLQNEYYTCNDKILKINLFDDSEKIILENNIDIYSNEKFFRCMFKMLIHAFNYFIQNDYKYKLIVILKPNSTNKIIKDLQKWFIEELLKIDNRIIGFESNNISELIDFKDNRLCNYVLLGSTNPQISIIDMLNNEN